MTHTKDHTGHSHTYEIKISAITESVRAFFRMIREKLELLPYASGNRIQPYYKNSRLGTDIHLNENVIRSQMYMR